jgi:type I restriction enzyme, S subunit
MAGEPRTNPTSLPPTPDGWRELQIEDLCERVTSGGTPSRQRPEFYENGLFNWFKTKELKDCALYDSEERITQDALDSSSAKLFPPDTVLMAMYGDGITITSLGILRRQAATNQACCAMIPKSTVCEPRFLFYSLLNHREDFIQIASGGAQRNLSGSLIRRFALNAPSLAEQKAIASILGALDDKIELNRRMNATLEAMARALFQSWFVDFDPVRAKLDGRQPIGLDAATAALFPAHFDHISEGVVPSGWRATTLSEAIEIFDSKRIPLSGREREARQGKYPYHGAASVMDYVDDFLFDGIYALMGEDGSVVNEDGTPVLQYAWGKFWVNNHAHVLRGKNGISTEHLLLHLKGSNIAPFVNGAVQPKLNQGNMNRIPFMLPPPEIGQAFARTIEPLFAQIRASTEQSRTLATLRDTLLPKLLSGELSVADVNAQVEDQRNG